MNASTTETFSAAPEMPEAPIVTEIKLWQTRSASAWEMAVETAEAESVESDKFTATVEETQRLADDCDAAYDAAIEAIEENDAGAARAALGEARSYERRGGDDSHARGAIGVLETYAAKAAYRAYCAEIGSTAMAEEEAILRLGREFLAPCAIVVFEGGEPTAEYWEWLLSQTDAAS